MKQIPHSDYMARVFKNANQASDSRGMMRRAFEATETEIRAEFGAGRYRDYNSFMSGKSRRPVLARLGVLPV